MADIDWIKLKSEYATTTISYRKMAEKYGISFNTIKEHARKDGWPNARSKAENKTASVVQQKIIKSKAIDCARQLKSVVMSAETAVKMVERMMADVDQFRRHLVIVKEGTGFGKGEYEEKQEVEERIYEKYDTQALKNFTGALKDLVWVIRNIYGLPTELEKSAMDMAIQRLQLDRDKAGVLDKDNAITVEFVDDDAEGYAG